VQGKAVENQLETLADPEGGQFGATAPPNLCAVPFNGAPLS